MAGARAGLPILELNDQNVPRDLQFDVFRATVAPGLFDARAPKGKQLANVRVETTDYFVEDIVMSRLRFDPLMMRRSARQARNGFGDFVSVLVHLDGDIRGVAGADTDVLGSGSRVTVLDMGEPFSLRTGRTDVLWLAIPKHRLPSFHRAFETPIAADEDRASALSAYVRDLWARLPTATPDESAWLAHGIAQAVDSSLLTDRAHQSDEVRLAVMKDYISTHLDDLDLDAERLATEFHWSRASVYRMFSASGGVGAYIRERRLIRCFEDLARPQRLPSPISSVANRWGFWNPSHFNRIFKAKFGVPPSHVVGRPSSANAISLPSDAERAVQEFHDMVRSRP